MTEIKILKDEIFEKVQSNIELRKQICEVVFVASSGKSVQQNSIRMLAIAKSNKLTRYDILLIIKRFLKLKTLEEMFITKEKI